ERLFVGLAQDLRQRDEHKSLIAAAGHGELALVPRERVLPIRTLRLVWRRRDEQPEHLAREDLGHVLHRPFAAIGDGRLARVRRLLRRLHAALALHATNRLGPHARDRYTLTAERVAPLLGAFDF